MFRVQHNGPLYTRILVLYAVVGGLVALIQLNYINADFVAYATIARRTIETPGSAVTAYWSSLFAWMMVPMLYFHIDDLVAGRVVLLASGAVYLSAIHRLTVLHSYGDRHTDQLTQIGTMTCALVQAVIWANYLLAPDLLANAILYIYFCIVSPRRSPIYQPARGMLAGFVAGFAYLAKAYMLPFCCAHFAMWLLMTRGLQVSRSSIVEQVKSGFLTLGLFGIGLGLVAGPWIASLSQKCGRLTISTAGSSNHANVSPENFRKDPLWNPGLISNYIFEPSLTPDWSAFQDTSHFRHQLLIVWHNLLNCVGLIPVWLLVFVGCAAALIYWKVPVTREESLFLSWIAMTVFVYCGGYTLVNLEARYIIPTVAPLLCYGSLLMLRSILNHLITFRFNSDKHLPLSDLRETHRRHFAELPQKQFARVRLSGEENSIYLDLYPELPVGSNRRAMVLAEVSRDAQAVHQVSSGDAFSDASLIDVSAGNSLERTTPPIQTHPPEVSLSPRNEPWPQSRYLRRVIGRSQPWRVCFAICLSLILSGVDVHNLCRVALRHPQACSMKQFHLVAERLHQLGVTEAPTACSDLHFGLYVAYASNRLDSYFGAPRSSSKSDLPGELAAKGVIVFLQIRPKTKIAALPSSDPPFGDDASWTKMATIRDPELLPDCLEVYVRR